MKRRIRCSCVAADGTQCGRSVTDGSQPPICHIHRHKANGTLAGIAQPAQRTPEEIVRKLLDDSDPSVRLRAVEMWQKHFESRNADNGAGHRDLIRLLTDDEKAALREAIDWIDAIKDAVYARHPDLEPDAST